MSSLKIVLRLLSGSTWRSGKCEDISAVPIMDAMSLPSLANFLANALLGRFITPALSPGGDVLVKQAERTTPIPEANECCTTAVMRLVASG